MATCSVTDAFSADTDILLNRFVKQNSTKFECFCTEWNRMNFQYVFCGYMCLSEMVQFLEDAFIVLKRALLNATTHFEKIGALYLMYTMYFKQPPKQYCKFRMTMSEWMKMNQFYNEVCIFHTQASLVFWKLLQNDAFRFVEAEYEYGFERFMQKGMGFGSNDGKFRKINPTVEKTITTMRDHTTGIIPALEILQVGYNEMKEHLNQTSSSMSATTIATDIFKGLEAIDKLFQVDPVIDVQEQDTDSCGDNNLKTVINTKRRQLKQKAFEGEQATSSKSQKKTPSVTHRTSITEDGDFLIIAKASHSKCKKTSQLNDREIKTVIKQLELPIDDELDLPNLQPSEAGTSKTSKKKKKKKKGIGYGAAMRKMSQTSDQHSYGIYYFNIN